MNTERLLAHYERIAGAPDAIARLRSFILNLAVRGKLVLQDPKDEPASELLKRIAKERARREKTRTLREQKSLPQISAEDIDFAICKGWQWVRLGDVIKLWNGFAFKSGDFQSEGVPVIRIGDLQDGVIKLSNAVYVSNATAKTVGPEVWIPPDALLIAMSGATTGKTAFNRAGIPLLLNQRVGRIEVFSGNVNYIRCFFETIVNQNLSISFGTAIPNLSTVQINETVIPLPPLAEQQRIVAKVDELMALCDRLEAARAEREATRDRLAAASLARLNTPDPVTFQDAARFVLNILPALTTRPDQIKQLRRTILNLAVRGKLVPQDPEDEGATKLIRRIAAQPGAKKRLRDAIPSQPVTLPFGWTWINFGALITQSDSGWSPKTEDHPKEGDAWGILKVSAVSWDKFRAYENKQVLRGTEPRFQAQVKRGDFLISRANTAELIARAVIVEEEPTNLMMSDKIVRLEITDLCDHRFVLIVNNYADFAREHYFRHASGVSPSMKNISRDVIMSLPFPLPPLAEQHRIVAKVDALMEICDQLESSFDTTTTTRHRLLDALLAEALEAKSSSNLEAAA